MPVPRCWIVSAVTFVIAATYPARSAAQIRYSSGQDVVPVFEGWERNPDRTINMVFGYMNRNYDEEVDIPVGADNNFSPGEPDRGQPAHFYTRRQEFVFKVKVPEDWGDKDLVWTLISRGKTEKAYGSLLPVWQINTLVYLENRKGAGALTYPEEPNQPPAIEMVGSSRRTVAAGEPLELSVDVMDDGYPMPRARQPRPRDSAANGPKLQSPATQAVVKLDPGVRLGVTWVVYRAGPGTVSFEPMRVPVVSSPPGAPPQSDALHGKAATTATFSEPGVYWLRAYADDSVLLTPIDVTVTVTPAHNGSRP
jgi:hypothetical protein